MKTLDIALIGMCAALYAAIGFLTSFGLALGGVAFWPAAIIPAVFAVLFGPWVGGIGAAIGIFVRDMLYHGDPILSLAAGVTGNFAAFFLLGYLSRTSFSRKKIMLSTIIGSIIIVTGIMLPILVLPTESTAFTLLSTSETIALFAFLITISTVGIILVFRFWRKWQNFIGASILGLGVGSAVLTTGLWAYSQIFFSAQGYIKGPISAAFAPLIFVWTFATEIPFVLLLGPPIINAGYKAFPNLIKRHQTTEKAK